MALLSIDQLDDKRKHREQNVQRGRRHAGAGAAEAAVQGAGGSEWYRSNQSRQRSWWSTLPHETSNRLQRAT